MQKVARLITRDQEPKIVVLSALSGTTNQLVQIGDLLIDQKRAEAQQLVHSLRQHYNSFVEQLFPEEKGLAAGKKIVETFFHDLGTLSDIPDFNEGNQKTVLALGELLSTHLFHAYLHVNHIDAALLPALEFMRIDESGEPEIEVISKLLNKILEKHSHTNLFITQGFICRNAKGQTDNLKRGGSDYSASLIGAALRAREVQIWTDIDGMHNNDPRIVDKTYPVAALTFDEAAELAYFGAKILHPASIQPAQRFNIPVWLKSTINEDAYGTLIGEADTKSEIKAVAAKDNITAIKIKSTRMLLAYGFLRRVFEIFEKYATPIDMITTSEVAVSLTIDNNQHLAAIIHDLESFGSVEVDHNMTIICVVGSKILEQNGMAQRIFNALENIPIRMVSLGGSKNNVSILLETTHKNNALKQLNTGLFAIAAAS
jgi:aspartate kinase